MSWVIVSDSSCDIRELKSLAPGVQFGIVPFKIRIGQREYVDLPTLNVPAMIQAMTDFNGASTTACPSPEEWAAFYNMGDNVIAVTISSNLSGSYNSAVAAREMVLEQHPEKNICVIDSHSTGGSLVSVLQRANQLIGEGKSFDEIHQQLQDHADSGHILFALASFENLAKNGRVNRVVGFLAGKLNMRVLGRRTPDGRIDFFYKTRGETRVLAKILEEMVDTGYDGSRPVIISQCNNGNAARLLRHGIRAKWPHAPIQVYDCGGLCSFYAQDQGIILTY